MNIYQATTGERRNEPLPSFTEASSLVDYDQKGHNWIFEGTGPMNPRGYVMVHKGRRESMNQPPTGDAVRVGNYWVNPSVAHGELALTYFDSPGHRLKTQFLSVPQHSVRRVLCFTVADDGWIAAELLLDKDSETRLLIFGNDLSLKKDLGIGGSAMFCKAGNRLVYLARSTKLGQNGEWTLEGTGSRNTIIYDIPDSRKRVLDLGQLLSADITDCRCTSDGNWLICVGYQPNFVRDLYAVDISHEKITWYKLPVSVNDMQWLVLDRMPESTPHSGKSK